jgi:hypothetical protein
VLLDYKIIPNRLYAEQKERPHKALYSIIDKNRARYRELLKNALNFIQVFSAIKEDKDLDNETEPGWNNKHLPGLDIIMLYSLLSEIKPEKYVEIGCGTSTKVAYKSKIENSLHYDIITIDPHPRKEIKSVVNKHYNEEIRKVDLDIFKTLKENDIVFFDGTHLLFPNSDVTWFFLEILPVLPKGVIVHLHDIYLPYDYPDFMCERYYNEQYVLAALLLSNSNKYEIICPNYFIYADKELSKIIKPVFDLPALKNVERHGGSFWFQIKN